MKLAIIGSRNLTVNNLKEYISEDVAEIVSGGAKGVDECAKKYAQENAIKYVQFLPQYDKFARAAPLKRNEQIIDYCDEVLAFWDGKSRGTKFVIDRCNKMGKKIKVVVL